MTMERSCGGIVFTRKDGQIRYVIIQSITGCYGFPKGHVEPGETEAQTALREIYEETGLKPTLLTGFRATDSYAIPKRHNTVKFVTYFLAEYTDQDICYQKEELRGARLLSYEEALKKLPFKNARRILTQANNFLTKREGS